MAKTYTKAIPMVDVYTVNGANAGAIGDKAAAAMTAYENKQILSLTADDDEVLVPYHAVQIFTSSTGTEEVTREDPYCDAESGDCKELFSGSVNINDDDDGESPFYTGMFDYTPDEAPSTLTVTIDGTTYENIPRTGENGMYRYGNYYPYTEEIPFSVFITITDYTHSAGIQMATSGTRSVTLLGCN